MTTCITVHVYASKSNIVEVISPQKVNNRPKCLMIWHICVYPWYFFDLLIYLRNLSGFDKCTHIYFDGTAVEENIFLACIRHEIFKYWRRIDISNLDTLFCIGEKSLKNIIVIDCKQSEQSKCNIWIIWMGWRGWLDITEVCNTGLWILLCLCMHELDDAPLIYILM